MASQNDDLRYLSASFDPSSLTMAELRNIFMTHDISYSASAKKPQLVDIFIQELKPKARKILAAHDRVRRTSRGIMDMPSSQEETVNGDFDDTGSMPPPPTPKQRKPRKSARTSAEPDVSEAPANPRTSSSRKSSSKHARQSDTETDRDLEPKRPLVRKSRKSEVTPKVKVEDVEDTSVRPPLRGGVFSDENPFQSGSSPLEPIERRRRTAGSSNGKRKSATGRRKTEGLASDSILQSDGLSPPTSKTFEIPVASLKRPSIKDESDDIVEAGEDFTPEEQLELVRERAAQGKRDILPPRRKKKQSQKSGTVPKSAPWVIFMALLGGYTTWWRQEKLAVGYCGIGRPSNALSNVEIPQWASALQPNCEPCPQHAICYEGMETRCEDDFVLQSHPLSLGGLVPLPPTCEPDGEKARRVKAVADRAVEELRERKAQAECGVIRDDTGKTASEDMTEKALKEEVAKKRRRGMGDAEFDDLWKGAIGEIRGRDEVIVSGEGPYLRLQSSSLARISVSCAVRRSARLTLARHRVSLSLLTLTTISLIYIRSLIRTSRSDTARVPSLVATTLDRLATQAALYSRGDAAESWISVGQLRDDVLRNEFSDKRRESMWKRVAVVVERNANVRASVREGRGGDVSRVWEWIGSVGLLDESWSGGRGSGVGKRVSLGGFVDSGSPNGPANPSGGEIVEQRKWDEGRPLY